IRKADIFAGQQPSFSSAMAVTTLLPITFFYHSLKVFANLSTVKFNFIENFGFKTPSFHDGF
ncbi:hypothetical protein, partial [Planktothrix sp.]|uniref:hypothetical protein n=1 Tax=Planktothrix sp. TaxID=3088171 RepID=UPI0038D3A29E